MRAWRRETVVPRSRAARSMSGLKRPSPLPRPTSTSSDSKRSGVPSGATRRGMAGLPRAQARLACRHGGVGRHAIRPKGQGHLANGNAVVVDQAPTRDPLAVDERAVHALQVLDPVVGAVESNLGVATRGLWIMDHDLTGGASADDGRR